MNQKKTLRITGLLLSGVFALTVGLTGCAEKKEPSSPSASESSVASQAESTAAPVSEPEASTASSKAPEKSTAVTSKKTSSLIQSVASIGAQDADIPPATARGQSHTAAYYAAYQQKTDLGWNLRLANKSNLMKKDISSKLTDVGSGRLFDDRAVNALNLMIKACRAAGNSLWAQSTYRTLAFQQQLMDNEIQSYVNQGYGKEEAKKQAANWVAPSGGSEHNLGLAVDFNNITDDFDQTDSFKWLSQHAAEYGFILRYPKDQTIITGYSYEPWHYRYIGKEHAQAMKKLGLTTLEEYIVLLEETRG